MNRACKETGEDFSTVKKPQNKNQQSKQTNQTQTVPVTATAPWKGMLLLLELGESVSSGFFAKAGFLPVHFEIFQLAHLIVYAALRLVQFVSM